VGLLPLHGSLLVLRLDPAVGGLEVGAVDGLVAERPDDDARMVEVHLHVVLVALQYLAREEGRKGDGLLTVVAESVALLVGFADEIDAVLVAEVVPQRVVGVVACAHGVDVEALHELQILDHALAADHVAAVGIHLVAVYTFYIYRLSVDEELRSANLHATETHALGNHLGGRRHHGSL